MDHRWIWSKNTKGGRYYLAIERCWYLSDPLQGGTDSSEDCIASFHNFASATRRAASGVIRNRNNPKLIAYNP